MPILKEFPSAGGSPGVPLAGVGGLLGADHGEMIGHLPQSQSNVELVSRLELNTPGFGPAAPKQIADVSVHKGTAYLTSWSEPKNAAGVCERGGIFSVDISNPAAPRQLAFRPSLPGNYHGEGAHTITFPDGRDILAVNNEYCDPKAAQGGGFALYDVSNPANPVKLVDAASDYGKVGELICCSPSAPGAVAARGHDYHSVFMWIDDGRVYLIGVDNAEQARTDVDIFDITNPSAPVAVREYDFDEEFSGIRDGEENGLGGNVLLHDMVVKEIDGVQTLLASYWDGGYLLLNVEDPANAMYIGDTRFADVDPLTGMRTPEGNAHQAEFSHDNQYILAADEDFDAFRVDGLINPGAADQSEFRAAGLTVNEEGTAFVGPQITRERSLTWDTRFVGTACNPAQIPLATGSVRIALVEIFDCPFRQKTEAVEARGYRGMIMFSASSAEVGPNDQDVACDNYYYIGGYDDYEGDVVTMWVPREVGFRMMGRAAGYSCGGANPTPTPTTVVEGVPVDISAKFDGWGYAHLYRRGSGKLSEVGKPFAIPEGLEERYATGFGELSIHEFATDPQVNLAYSSYYSGGLRVLSFGEAGLQEVGRYIGATGNNFWGVEQFTSGCDRLIAASDRDTGLYIFKYTGPGAAKPCTTPPAATPAPPAQPGKDLTKPRISLLSNSRQSMRNLRSKGLRFRIRVDEAVKLEVSLRGRFTVRGARGKLQTLSRRATVNVRAGQTVTVTVKATSRMLKRLRKEKRLPGLLSVKATDAAGNTSTRTKVVTFR